MVSNKCPSCGLMNFSTAYVCKRCGAHLPPYEDVDVQSRGKDSARRVLRKVLGGVEIGAAAVLLLFAIKFCLYDDGHRIGGDGIATGIARMFAVPLVLFSVGLALAGVKAGGGGQRWWVWQAAIPAFGVGGSVVALLMAYVYLGLRELF
jgi:hypothetical protein